MSAKKFGRNKLTTRQEAYKNYRLAGKGQKDAAVLAGYSARTAHEAAYRLEQHPLIRRALARARRRVAKEAEVEQAEVLAELARIMRACVTDVFDFNEDGITLKASDAIAARVFGAIAEVSEVPLKGGGVAVRVKFHSKTDAIDKICRMLGFYAPEKKVLTGEEGGPIQVKTESGPDLTLFTESELKQLRKLYAAADARRDRDRAGSPQSS